MTPDTEETPARILLGEDNPADVYLIRQALDENGVRYTLEVAAHGGEMLAKVGGMAAKGPAGLIDLLVLDLNLPRHDGLEILKLIRQNEAMAGIPVVILTSSDSPKDRVAASDLGADRYVRKPSNLDEFMAIGLIFRSLLAERRKGLG